MKTIEKRLNKFMEKLCEYVDIGILKADNCEEFYRENKWLNRYNFNIICKRYGFPDRSLTVVIEYHYIDAAYRDVYYHYWSRFHFDWERHAKRVLLFSNCHSKEEFYDIKYTEELENDFLGAIIVRPPYSDSTDHTFGKTLLTPYKMIVEDKEGFGHSLKYLETAEYKIHLLGNTYRVNAFPFSSQDGVALKCAETAIYVLCEYASTHSSLYRRVLPSDIQSKLEERLPERILPSRGLYCNDISYLLREFGFSPMIYAASDNKDNIAGGQRDSGIRDLRIGLICSESTDDFNLNDDIEELWDNKHVTDFKKWFHYYVESGIPILTITSPNQEVNKHAVLVIGHGTKRKPVDECKIYKLGRLPCMDTSELYEHYIVQDDNQIPYVEEELDKFTQSKNYKLDAFIVPLARHVFLEASSAVSICDTFIAEENEMIIEAVDYIITECHRQLSMVDDDETREQYLALVDAFTVSEDNPITIRYYLTNSAEYKQYRIASGITQSDKTFYADIPMPKAVWIAEISTYKCYEMGYGFGEVVLDATASNQSKLNSVLLIRMAHLGVYRLPNETYDIFKEKMKKHTHYMNLSSMLILFSNFINSEWKEEDE